MVSETELVELKKLAGRRVRVTGIQPYDPCPLEIGDEGIVRDVDDGGTLHVKWNSGRTLGLAVGDPYEVLS